MKDYLVLNYILVSEFEILVGATNRCRWESDMEACGYGGDAFTFVMATLTMKPGYATGTEAKFYTKPGADAEWNLSMKYLYRLFEIAFEIKDSGINEENAREKYYGMCIGKNISQSN